MAKRLEFTPEIRATLNYERYHHPIPLVQRRMEVLWLKSHDLPHATIACLGGVSENTMREYFQLYEEGGIEKLKEVNFYRPESELCAHITAAPAAYLEQEIEPRLTEAQAGKRAVFFVDAAHFVLAPFLGFLWSLTRVFVKAPSGRQRFNVLGALNAITHELVTVTNDTYITATQVCELLYKLAALNLGVPITIFLDNARYCCIPRRNRGVFESDRYDPQNSFRLAHHPALSAL